MEKNLCDLRRNAAGKLFANAAPKIWISSVPWQTGGSGASLRLVMGITRRKNPTGGGSGGFSALPAAASHDWLTGGDGKAPRNQSASGGQSLPDESATMPSDGGPSGAGQSGGRAARSISR